MKRLIPLLLLTPLVFTGCETTRSISDSGYHSSYGWAGGGNPMYRGELTELDILGTAATQEANATNIAKVLETAAAPKIKRGDKVILIQSGAIVPDNGVVEEAMRYFSVAPFSGIPSQEKAGLADSLRLRAAQGGYRYIVCYWGVLESAQEDHEGKIVSWVPIVGGLVPDQRQEMRIRLRAILLDVATGAWKMFMPEVHSDAKFNSKWSREQSDQKLVEALKEKGYKSLITEMLKD